MKKFTRRSREFVTKIKTSLTSVSKSSKNDVKTGQKNESKQLQNLITTSSDDSSEISKTKISETKISNQNNLQETETDKQKNHENKLENTNKSTRENPIEKITSPLSNEYSQDYNDVDSGLTRTPQNADFLEEVTAPEECKLKKTNPLLELQGGYSKISQK